jgi:hypothetical protein
MKRPIPNLPGYFMDLKGMICYLMGSKWMYCKKIDTKPGWVWIYQNGIRVPHHQKHTAELMLKQKEIERPFRTKPLVEPPDEDRKPSAIQPSTDWE